MKKQDVLGIIVYIIILVLAFVFGLLVIREYYPSSGMSAGLYVLFVLGNIVLGVILNAIMYELAHVVGAKLGHYDIVSVSILRFTWFKKDGKMHFHFVNYDGLTGETKIKPREGCKKKPSPTLYLINGTIFYAIEVIVVIFLFSILTSIEGNTFLHKLGYALLIIMWVGGMILIYNIIPLQLDSMNDGYKLRLFSNKDNKEAFNKLMFAENDVNSATNGNTTSDDSSSAFSNDIKLNKVYQLLDQQDFKNAEKLVDEILSQEDKDVTEKVHMRAKAQKIYIVIMSKSLPEAKGYYEAHVPMNERRWISSDTSMVCVRAYILMSSLLDKSRSECVLTLKRAYKAYKHTPIARQSLEITLFNLAIDKINEEHPTWELLEYKMKDSDK